MYKLPERKHFFLNEVFPYNKPSKPCNTHSNLEVLEGLHDVRPHVLRTVVGVPQLGLETQVKKRTCHREFSQILSRNSQSHLNKQLLPLDDPSGKELLESLPDDVLVVVVVGAVQHPVAGLHRCNHRLLRLLRWSLVNITMISIRTNKIISEKVVLGRVCVGG